MCGISAIISSSSTNSMLPLIEVMSDQIRHRGPDGEGYFVYNSNENKTMILGGQDTNSEILSSAIPYTPSSLLDQGSPFDANIALGHRRLAIVDLTPTGHQPMSYANGRYWITYNGEVYNYLEIRDELIEKGYSFVSKSDTEVILAAYDCWGNDCLTRFNGMFAFILIDLEEDNVFAARDRFGVKPLYYWRSPVGFIAFASEIKQFTSLPGWNACLNNQMAYDFLCFGMTDHTSETMFKNVYQLRGGDYYRSSFSDLFTFIDGDVNKLKVQRWYDLKHNINKYNDSIIEAVNDYTALFYDAVKLRLRADVPVGSCLSGGLDSSSIVCIAKEILKQRGGGYKQKTFSACAIEKKYDEREYLEEVVKQTGVDAYYVYPTISDLFEDLDSITWHQDEPFGSTSIFAQWQVFKDTSRNQVKVMLDGQGGDEQLAGYSSYYGAFLVGLIIRMKFMTAVKEYGYSGLQRIGFLKLFFANSFPFISRFYDSILNNNRVKPSWLNHELLEVNFLHPLSKYQKGLPSIKRSSIAQLVYTNLPQLLHWEDRDSMAHSVESRVPFVDYRLMEFALSLKDEFKINKGIRKYILREAMRGHIPDRVTDRRDKMGFVTPEELWMKEQAPDRFRQELSDAIDVSHGLINASALLDFDRVLSGAKKFDFTIWRLISFGRWVKRFNVKMN